MDDLTLTGADYRRLQMADILRSPVGPKWRTPDMQQLNPPIPLTTPKGKALAHLVLDYGPEFDLLWVCFDDATGECWTWPNHQIRGQHNITMGRDLK